MRELNKQKTRKQRATLGAGGVVLVFGILLLSLTTITDRAQAQYMYLDSNGDGYNSEEDRLNLPGVPTQVTVYLATSYNGSWFDTVCSTGPEPLTLNSYTFILRAEGGTVTFGSFSNLQPSMGTSLGTRFSDTDFYTGRGGGTILEPGVYELGTITVTVMSDAPSLTIAQSTQLGNGFRTSFGTQCAGLDQDNTYKLGTDWFDTNGLAAPDFPPEVSAPPSTSAIEGESLTLAADITEHGEAPLIQATGYPASLSLDVEDLGGGTSRAVLTGVVGPQDAGTYSVVWAAIEASGNSASDTTDLYIIESNHPPSVIGPQLIEVVEGALVDFRSYADDPDDDPISSFAADLAGLPSGSTATFTLTPDNTEGRLQWAPTYYHAGEYVITFSATSLSMTGNGQTTIRVLNAPSPAPQFISSRVQMPGVGYKIVVTASKSPFTHAQEVYYSNDSGAVYVPLQYVESGNLYWYWRIGIDFPGETYFAHMRLGNGSTDALSASVDWSPAETFPGYNYTPPPDPTHVYALNMLRPIVEFYASQYGVRPSTVPITRFWTANPSAQLIYYSHNDEGIHWPATPTVYNQQVGDFHPDWTMAHEFAHHLQSYVYSPDPAYCPGAETHGGNYCDSVLCAKDAWDEGMADGMAEFYNKLVRHNNYVFGACPGPKSILFESGIADFVYALGIRNAQAFMDTWKYARFRLEPYDPGPPHRAISVDEYYAAWRDVNPGSNATLVDHHPGPFSIDTEYVRYVLGQEPPATDVEVAMGTAGAPGIRRISPNPGGGRFRLVAGGLPSGGFVCEVFDVQGRLVSRQAIEGVQAGTAEWNVDGTGLSAGIYFVQLRSYGGTAVGRSKRIVVIH